MAGAAVVPPGTREMKKLGAPLEENLMAKSPSNTRDGWVWKNRWKFLCEELYVYKSKGRNPQWEWEKKVSDTNVMISWSWESLLGSDSWSCEVRNTNSLFLESCCVWKKYHQSCKKQYFLLQSGWVNTMMLWARSSSRPQERSLSSHQHGQNGQHDQHGQHGQHGQHNL